MAPLAVFTVTGPVEVLPGRMRPLKLRSTESQLETVTLTDAGIVFIGEGWFEVLLKVAWDPTQDAGYRFAHTTVPDRHPLHSEAIDAAVLNRISNGTQLLRGNSWFGTDELNTINLEVWHNSPDPVLVTEASLAVRPLPLPRPT